MALNGPTGTDSEALRALWGGAELARLWGAARRRLERNGRMLAGRPVVVRDPPTATRDRVAALLGELRRPDGDLRVSLTRLDGALRASRFGLGLLDVLEALDGRPVGDRRAERDAARRARDGARRELWEAAGVVSNPLTCHVLVLNLPLAGDGRIARRLREAAAVGMAERLLLSQLRAESLDAAPLAGRTVRVCENPVVVERAEAAL